MVFTFGVDYCRLLWLSEFPLRSQLLFWCVFLYLWLVGGSFFFLLLRSFNICYLLCILSILTRIPFGCFLSGLICLVFCVLLVSLSAYLQFGQVSSYHLVAGLVYAVSALGAVPSAMPVILVSVPHFPRVLFLCLLRCFIFFICLIWVLLCSSPGVYHLLDSLYLSDFSLCFLIGILSFSITSSFQLVFSSVLVSLYLVLVFKF